MSDEPTPEEIARVDHWRREQEAKAEQTIRDLEDRAHRELESRLADAFGAESSQVQGEGWGTEADAAHVDRLWLRYQDSRVVTVMAADGGLEIKGLRKVVP